MNRTTHAGNKRGEWVSEKASGVVVESVTTSGRGYQGTAFSGKPQLPKGGTAVMLPRHRSSTIGKDGDSKR